MLAWLPWPISAIFSFTLFAVNLMICGTMVTLASVLRLVLPFAAKPMSKLAHWWYQRWAIQNGLLINLFNRVNWRVEVPTQLSHAQWYLLIANHRSWLDIPMLTWFAAKRLPAPKFFLKDQLKYVPFVGSSAWALDMPFMKRYSRATLAKHPHLKGKDIEATRKSCQAFMENPTTIINFVEGTRFSPSKHHKQNSPFNYLLKPKAGGIAFTLGALGDRFDKVLMATLYYPDCSNNIAWDMLCGRLTEVVLHVQAIDMAEVPRGDYFNDEQYQIHFQHWLNQRWQEQDALLEQLLKHELNGKNSHSAISASSVH